ncbi:MAG: formate--tetrahydrofolate ligase [Oscillospiraceae bacterium]|jgi:formate--tetrahydrofolate ligase|nr:formate--tetrahydrofolate ligase [Oscillospiraceae bacterium]
MTDMEIALAHKPKPILEIAATAGLSAEECLLYGPYKAKVTRKPGKTGGKLVLVTAMTPTRMGEGKTTVSVGLADGLRHIGRRAMLCLREPSLGPVFGMKGGAAGGGYAQVVPMEDINLHFTGDIHAVTAANNLLAAAADNKVFQDGAGAFEDFTVTWRRCMDMNDRALRQGFDISAASEVMAILCLSEGIENLKERLGRAVAGVFPNGKRCTCAELGVHGAMAALLRDALLPNLVSTLEHTPTLIHGGPFANIAHGCNSLAATKLALSLADIVVTEAGFGADLGAEKFMDIKCRAGNLRPSCCVIVATARACAHHGGTANLAKHIENVTGVFRLPAVVAVNKFSSDTEADIDAIRNLCESMGVPCAVTEAWEKGGAGAELLASLVAARTDKADGACSYTYAPELPLAEKIHAVATCIYGADGVTFSPEAEGELSRLQDEGYGRLPVCVAKTQYSLSDDPKKLGRPEGFSPHITHVRLCAGAGFAVAYAGAILTMPGLPKKPAYEAIDIDNAGIISGLF